VEGLTSNSSSQAGLLELFGLPLAHPSIFQLKAVQGVRGRLWDDFAVDNCLEKCNERGRKGPRVGASHEL
jgi:hypothetical protein